MIRAWIVFLFVFFVLFPKIKAFGQNKEERSLLKQLKESKSVSRRVEILNDLNVLYRTKNLSKQKWIISNLTQEKAGDISKSNLDLINLNLLEEFLANGNLSDLKIGFDDNFNNVNFRDANLANRYAALRVEFAYLFDKGDYLKFAKKALEGAQKSRKNAIISDAYINLSKAFSYKNCRDSALLSGQLATEFAYRSSSKIKLALSLRNQAKLLLFFGKNNDAVVKILEFLQVAKETENELLISLANIDLGFVLLEAENYTSASIFFKRAKQIGQTVLDDYQLTLLNVGQILCESNQDNMQVAKELLSKIKTKNSIRKSDEIQGLLYYVKGIISESESDWEESIRFQRKAIIQFESLKDGQKIGIAYQHITKCQLKLKKYNEAEKSVFESIKNKDRLTPNVSNDNFRLLAEIYESTNKLKQAYHYQKLYLENERKLTISKDAVSINELTESNLREEREKLIQDQNVSIENDRKEKERLEVQRTRNLLIAIIIFVIFILGIIIMTLRNKQIRLQQEQKEAEMSQALLRTQMNPHFIFNAMSVIQSYIFTHTPEKSSKFLVNFSKLMRLILENSPKEFIPLELEEEILEKYLNTQKLRFEDRFEFELQFDNDLISKKSMVPPMITQPFVENAIEHGQLHTVENGKIIISARQRDKMLEIIVVDNGIGRVNSAKTKKIKAHKSMAIDLTAERIEILNRKYRSTGNLTIEDNDALTGRGTKVTILLPLKFE
jgi:tetratricopeptide (TPR) repeat protein/anti-sigma regulatory factor (Ser/Thr protein kinase)